MDEKIYKPEVVADNPFPGESPQQLTTPAPSTQGDIIGPAVSREKGFPIKRTAVELLSEALNTRSKKILQEFQFTPSGALQIGNFEEGETGDIRLSPNGIVARDLAGLVTFALDGTNGSAVFKGEVRSGSIVTGRVVVGNNRVIIEVDENGQGSIIVNDGTYDRVIIGLSDF